MTIAFKIFKSGLTDKLAYGAAFISALWWVLHIKYPAAVPDFLKRTDPLYGALFSALAGEMLIAKYVFMGAYSQVIKKIMGEKEDLTVIIRKLKGDISEIEEERDSISERERLLKQRLNGLENTGSETQLSSLRKKIRAYEEDRKTALAYLVRELREQLMEAEKTDDKDIIGAVAVLRKEIQFLEDEVRRGGMSLYELILKAADIRESIFDLATLCLSTGERNESMDYNRFKWFDGETDLSRVEHVYKFLKVAFHPDRFSSGALKEEAHKHFQETLDAYKRLKEGVRRAQ